MAERNVLWGDLHTHFTDFDNGDDLLQYTKENIDFSTVLCYPFVWESKNGLQVESVGQRPEFLQWWERLRELARAHHDPGRFVTYLAYEWHGNRTRYGDHNVIYYDEDNPLDDAWSLPELYEHLRTRKALAIPHHTGYATGYRGKDWNVYDEALSPVMEVFSVHGSSEGESAPRPMDDNSSMAPRTSGGTFHEALARGHRIGVIGSNDYVGMPGRWGLGRAGVWAEACTREAIWEALLARRTYAVTGDRMLLDFRIEGAPMGSVVQAGGVVDAEVTLTGCNAIDRVELLHNGSVVDTYCHAGGWERGGRQPGRHKVFVEAGWGPAAQWGFTPAGERWSCRLDLDGGRLIGTEKCFSLPGQRITSQDERHCTWQLATAPRTVHTPFGMRQGVIFEIEGNAGTRLLLDVDGMQLQYSLAELADSSHLVPFVEESKRRIRDTFGLEPEELGNPDPIYHNARKFKLHRAVPERGYRVHHVFRGLALEAGRNYFYVRATQRNGQMAWSSPIWVDADL